MKQILSTLNSDAINRYGMKFTISGLESGLAQSFLEGIPTNIGHDVHRLAGWTRPIGLYIEPGLTQLIGTILLPDTEEEKEYLYKIYQKFIQNLHDKQCGQYLSHLRELLQQYLSGKEKCIYVSCVAIWDDDIAKRVFPEIFQEQDKDELIPLNSVLQYFEPIGTGVFKSKDKELTLFAHPYFRKSLSRSNNYYRAFLDQLINLRNRNSFDIKLGFDSDLVGYSPTYKNPIELEFWRGPKFSDDIAKISTGVTVHASTDYQKIFHGISKTEFWWKEEDSIRVFEAEELKEIPSYGIGKDQFGCRYVHAIIDISNKTFNHFDGAIRMYTVRKMKERALKDIKKAGKHTEYTKLFRVDGVLSISEWKSLVSDYFQGNPLVIEYFGEDREHKLEPAVIKKGEIPDAKYAQCPYSLDKGMGIRLMISYHPIDEKSLDKEREVIVFDNITIENNTFKIIEHDAMELKKALQRVGDNLELPIDARFLAYEDLYLNLPLVRHSKKFFPKNLQRTIKAIELIIHGLYKKDANHVISFILAWPTESREIRLSVLGHIEDTYKWLTEFSSNIPISDNQIVQWLESVGKWLTQKYPEAKNIPHLSEIAQSTGVLWIHRRPLSQDIKLRVYFSDKHNALMSELSIPKTEKQLVEAIKNNQIQIAPAFFIKDSKCSKCKEEYKNCPHSKFLDPDVYQIIDDTDFAFAFWTNKKA